MAWKAEKWLGVDSTSVELHPATLEVGKSTNHDERLEKKRIHRLNSAESRERLTRRLEDEGRYDLAQKLAGCGCPVPITCVCCGAKKTVETRCKKRWCPACAHSIQQERIKRFGGAIKLMQWPMFLTLTMPNSKNVESVRELRKGWGKMRRRKLIAERVLGGVAAIEVTNKGKGWHPHLHAVIDCVWLAVNTPAPTGRDSINVRNQKYEHARLELSAIWGNVLRQPSAIVLAKRIKDQSAAVYMLKYATKSSELLECKESVGDLIDVLDKSRLVSAFGNLHGRTREMQDDERPGLECENCGNLKSYLPQEIIDRMTRREPWDKLGTVCFQHNFKQA